MDEKLSDGDQRGGAGVSEACLMETDPVSHRAQKTRKEEKKIHITQRAPHGRGKHTAAETADWKNEIG